MIGFFIRKITKNKWLMLCLLLGNVILLGIVTGTPLFNAATKQRILQEDLRASASFPAVMRLDFQFNAVQPQHRDATYRNTRDTWWPDAVSDMGIPPLFERTAYIFANWETAPVNPREEPNRYRPVDLAGVRDFSDLIEIVIGREPVPYMAEGNVIEVLATDIAMQHNNLILGELMSIRNPDDPLGTLFMRVVGIFTLPEETAAQWSILPINFMRTLLMHDELAGERFIPNYIDAYRLTVTWATVLDSTFINILDVPSYLETADTSSSDFNRSGGIWAYGINFYDTIQNFTERTDQLTITLWILMLPIYVMLALYIFMVSRQILILDQNEISILASRGASRFQVLGIYSLQGIFVAGVSFLPGLGLGILFCHVLGASSGFLEMAGRTALEIIIVPEALFYGLLASGFSFLTMFLPVIRFSKTTIVDHKRGSGKVKQALWKRYFLDILCLGFSIYGLYVFSGQQREDVFSPDPMLFANSSLFIIGAGLFVLRIYPYIIRLIFAIGSKIFPPSLYASMIRAKRSAGDEQFIMIFLIFTVSVGIFSAQAARTINMNNEHNIMYAAGADLVFREIWTDNIPSPQNPNPPTMLVYNEPDFERFTDIPEVEVLTRVMRRNGSISARGSNVAQVNLMGIDTQSFGETVWFRQDLSPLPLHYFLNALAMNPSGAILSDNFRTRLNYNVGDVITITETPRFGPPGTGRFTVVGFVEYFPGFVPVETTRLETGEIITNDPFLAVVNLGHIETNWGVRPYEVWMRVSGYDNSFFADLITTRRIRLAEIHDSPAAIAVIQGDPIVQGTNGVLTVNFIATLIICFVGLLIYWILSIRSRILQFGIFRAMGMGMRGIIGMLISEQMLINITAVGIGILVGEIAATLFVPLIQVSYAAADRVIPLIVVMETRDYVSLFTFLGVMMLLCLSVIVGYVSNIKISRVLKLGED